MFKLYKCIKCSTFGVGLFFIKCNPFTPHWVSGRYGQRLNLCKQCYRQLANDTVRKKLETLVGL